MYSCIDIREAQTQLFRPFVIAFLIYVLNLRACSEEYVTDRVAGESVSPLSGYCAGHYQLSKSLFSTKTA